MNLKSRKEGRYLVFEFEDGKNVKYDLSNGQTIGKLGKPVKDICTQLRGYNLLDVIESFDDIKYRRFLMFADRKINRSTDNRNSYYGYTRVDKIKNVGSFLSRLSRYSRYEQLFSTGIKFIDDNFSCSVNEIPKGLIKLCREKDLKLTDRLVNSYKNIPNDIINIMDMEFNTLTNLEALNILLDAERYRDYGYETSYLHIRKLLDEHNYKLQSLFTYFDNLMTYEALQNISSIVSEFYDYVNMMSKISNKYEKYPKNFLTTHKIACRNYNRLKEVFEEKAFEKRIDKSMEYTYGKYRFIYPNTTQDIKDEAVQQNNCVASYIKRVIDGGCHIIFMRYKDSKDASLVTLEIRDNKIVQARGKFNRDVTSEEQVVIDKWNQMMERKLNKNMRECA